MNKTVIKTEGDWYLVAVDTPSACSDTSQQWVHQRDWVDWEHGCKWCAEEAMLSKSDRPGLRMGYDTSWEDNPLLVATAALIRAVWSNKMDRARQEAQLISRLIATSELCDADPMMVHHMLEDVTEF